MTGKELLYTIYQKLENYTVNLTDTYNDLVENDLNCELEFSANEIMNEKQFVFELMYQFPKLEKKLDELAKYRRAFEILKEKLEIYLGKDDYGEFSNFFMNLDYFADVDATIELSKEEYELLEELMKDE